MHTHAESHSHTPAHTQTHNNGAFIYCLSPCTKILLSESKNPYNGHPDNAAMNQPMRHMGNLPGEMVYTSSYDLAVRLNCRSGLKNVYDAMLYHNCNYSLKSATNSTLFISPRCRKNCKKKQKQKKQFPECTLVSHWHLSMGNEEPTLSVFQTQYPQWYNVLTDATKAFP